MPDKLSRFWQELKRRKVTQVITVYAAAAFVILELTDIVAPSLGLPDWTLNFVIVLLCVGFIIALILSWIYDVGPEGGIVRTEPVNKAKGETVPSSSSGWKLASYISFAVIVGLIVLNIFHRSGKKEILERSIAVLPFINDSPEKENEYFLNGIMDEVLINLQTIKDLRVISRNSVEQYRAQGKPSTPEIAEKLGVNYIIEASGQKYGNTFILRVLLIEGKNDRHLWARSYEQQIESVEDITRIHSGIAKSIAAELQVVITPEEKKLIEKIPTTKLTAQYFYQRGNEEHWKYWSDNDNREALERAEKRYQDALENDPEFAKAYAGLASVYRDKYYWETFLSGNFLDSVLILADAALSFDDQLAEAYTIRGDYYSEIGYPEQAIREYDKAIKLNPNDWRAYKGKGILYWFKSDYVKAIDNFQKAVNLNRGSELPNLLGSLGMAYRSIGFIEISKDYSLEALRLSGDSIVFYRDLSYCEIVTGNYLKGADYAEKLQKIDTNNVGNLSHLGFCYVFLGYHKEALELYKRYIEKSKIGEGYSLFDMHRIGWAYWQNGYKEEAENYFKQQIDYCNRMSELGRRLADSNRTAYDLAAVYAFLGETEKAYENLKIHNQRQANSLGHFTRIKNDPLFDNIRDEPEFQRIVGDIEAKYQAEHERVRQWLEENDML